MTSRRHFMSAVACALAWTLPTLALAADEPIVHSSDIANALSSKDIVLDSATPSTPTERVNRHPPHQRREGRIDLRVQFALNSAEILPAGKRQLKELAQAFQAESLAQEAFEIIGHTDDSGTQAFNNELSLARAQSVKAYLVGVQGVAAQRLTAIGRGSSELLDAQHPESAVNRRVEIRRVRRF